MAAKGVFVKLAIDDASYISELNQSLHVLQYILAFESNGCAHSVNDKTCTVLPPDKNKDLLLKIQKIEKNLCNTHPHVTKGRRYNEWNNEYDDTLLYAFTRDCETRLITDILQGVTSILYSLEHILSAIELMKKRNEMWVFDKHTSPVSFNIQCIIKSIRLLHCYFNSSWSQLIGYQRRQRLKDKVTYLVSVLDSFNFLNSILHDSLSEWNTFNTSDIFSKLELSETVLLWLMELPSDKAPSCTEEEKEQSDQKSNQGSLVQESPVYSDNKTAVIVTDNIDTLYSNKQVSSDSLTSMSPMASLLTQEEVEIIDSSDIDLSLLELYVQKIFQRIINKDVLHQHQSAVDTNSLILLKDSTNYPLHDSDNCVLSPDSIISNKRSVPSDMDPLKDKFIREIRSTKHDFEDDDEDADQTEKILCKSAEAMIDTAHHYRDLIQKDKRVLDSTELMTSTNLQSIMDSLTAIKLLSWGKKLSFFQEMCLFVISIIMFCFIFSFIFASIPFSF